MSTRGRIGLMEGETCTSVYTHWDSYPEHNGKILFDHYDETKVRDLLEMGTVSSLSANLGEYVPVGKRKGAYYQHDPLKMPTGKVTEFHYRDLNGTVGECLPDISHNYRHFIHLCRDGDAEYAYIMKDGVWYMWSYDNYNDEILELLGPVLEKLLRPSNDAKELRMLVAF